jgi:hypothetical protein
VRYLVEQITDLKVILHAKRANIYYLEKCRVMQKDGRVLYLTEAKAENQYWNIPIANTTCLLLGTGTSITQAAIRMLASASSPCSLPHRPLRKTDFWNALRECGSLVDTRFADL